METYGTQCYINNQEKYFKRSRFFIWEENELDGNSSSQQNLYFSNRQNLPQCNGCIVVEYALQLLSFSLYLQILLSDISRYGESNHHLHDNSGPRQPCSAPNTQQAPTHGCPKRCFLYVCVCVVNTQGVLEKQPNYRSVIYAIAGPCLQLLRRFLFIKRRINSHIRFATLSACLYN